MNTQRATIHALAGVIAGAALLGCASTQVTTDRDVRENLLQYRTFDVAPGEVVMVTNGAIDRRTTAAHYRVESALEQGLQEKGLEHDVKDPDLIATYTAGNRDVVEIEVDGPAFGYGPVWSNEYAEHALLIELIDYKTNELVWRTVVRMDDEGLRSSQQISEAVDKALAKFPEA